MNFWEFILKTMDKHPDFLLFFMIFTTFITILLILSAFNTFGGCPAP